MDKRRTVSDHVAERVRRLRQARRLTVAELAGRCATAGWPQLSTQVIYKLEGQRDTPDRPPRPVTIDELLVLAEVLDVPATELCPELARPAAAAMTNAARAHPREAIAARLRLMAAEVELEDWTEDLAKQRAARGA
jgi:transcriptional regulator with XRE-family HTH domain